MADVLLKPIADELVGAFSPFPTSPATHWDKIDENPHDGAVSVLRGQSLGIERFVWDVSGIPYHPPQGRLLLRWAAIEGVTNPGQYTARAGLYIGGNYYWKPTRTLAGVFTVYDETFLVDPSDGGAWSRTKLEATRPALQLVTFALGLPRCEFSQLVGLIEKITDPLARTAGAGANAGLESGSSEQSKLATSAAPGPGSLRAAGASLGVQTSAVRLGSAGGGG